MGTIFNFAIVGMRHLNSSGFCSINPGSKRIKKETGLFCDMANKRRILRQFQKMGSSADFRAEVSRQAIMARLQRQAKREEKHEKQKAGGQKTSVKAQPEKTPPATLSPRVSRWEKHPTPEQIRQFWKDFDAEKNAVPGFRQKGRRRTRSETRAKQKGRNFERQQPFGAEPVWVTPTLIGRVRQFQNQQQLDAYINHFTTINRMASQKKFDYFDFLPGKIWNIQHANPAGPRALERAFLAPSVFQLVQAGKKMPNVSSVSNVSFFSLYGKSFERKMKQKEVSLNKIVNYTNYAMGEIQDFFGPIGIRINESQVLVVDFKPKTGKPLLTILPR